MDNKVLFCSLPGTGLPDLVDRFAEESRNYPFETFCVVSTSRLKEEVITRVQEKGITILKDRICTLGEIAKFIFSEHIPAIDCINDEESRLIILHIITANHRNLPLFNDGCRTSQKFVQEMKRFISALIQRKTDYPGCLAELQSEKSKQLALIHSNYFKFLFDNRIVDDEILLDKATKCLKKNEASIIKRVFMYGFYEPNPLEKEFIIALGNSSTLFHYTIPFADNSRIFIDRGVWLPITQEVIIESNAEDLKLSRLFGETHGFDFSDKIFLSKFKDRVTEIRAIAQEICSLIAKGANPADIAVVLPDRDRAVRIISDVFPDFRIPFDARKSSILSHAAIIQTIIDIIEIPAHNYKRDSVVKLLKSPYIQIPFEDKGNSILMGYEVDFESRSANIIAGREDWKKLQSMMTSLQEELDAEKHYKKNNSAIKDRIHRINNIVSGIENLFSCLQRLEGEKPVKEHIKILGEIIFKDLDLKPCAKYPDEELRENDSRALNEFIEVMNGIKRIYLTIPDEIIDLKDFLAILLIGLSEKRYDSVEENKSAVQLVGLREITHLTYDYIFIPDLVDGEIPRTNLSQPFSSGSETERMGLLTKRDLLRQERYYFLAATLAARQKLFLSHPSSEQDQPLIPSIFIRNILESFKIGSWKNNEISYSTIMKQLNDGKRISNGGKSSIKLLEVSLEDAILIAQKINIEMYYRKMNYKSEFDGILGDDPVIAPDLLSRFSESKVYSPTMFESYGLCPFHFYLRYVLYLDALPDIENSMSSTEFGGMFHRIAFRFYTNRRRYGNTKVAEEELITAIEDIKEIAQEEFQNYSFGVDPVWSSMKQRLMGNPESRKGILENFVRCEAEGLPPYFSPANFELSIGNTTSTDLSDECSKEDPVSLDLGPEYPSHVLVQGRIDRLDVTEDGKFMVIDYKTGAANPSYKDIASGISFQLPVYIRCIETCFPGMQGIAGSYYIVKSDGELAKKIVLGDKNYTDLFEPLGRSHGINDDYQEVITSSLKVIKKYIQDMRKGIFHPTVLAGRCPSYCDYRTVCRYDSLRILESEEVS
jgi:ATP-dependent helicase/DNAse subunit B